MSYEIPTDVTIKILLVDDEVNITKALKRLLMEVDQYEIVIANSGADALEEIQESPDIGLIISDQRMPGMTGVEFLSQARTLLPDAVRILLTGYADIEASIGAINQGAVFRYLTKPWDDEDLLKVVAEAAHGYWLRAENRRLNELVAKQNEELQNWNSRLKQRVLDQTSQIRAKSDALAETNQLLRSSFSETIDALAGLIQMREQNAPNHSRNVAELVKVLSEKIGMSVEERERAFIAGLLHDIGKIAISDRLLVKSYADLDKKEIREYQSHAIRGQSAIDHVPALRDIGLLIRHHHEHFNGHGFPDKLKGEEIPLGSRLICIADMFERMLSQFPESDAVASALEELKSQWGKTLDPALRIPFEEVAPTVFKQLDISAEVLMARVSPKELEIGMLLKHDLYSGTGVLLLKKGTVFNEAGIDAVKRCLTIDPFEREIEVLIDRSRFPDQAD